MKTYRLANFQQGIIQDYIQPGYEVFTLMEPTTAGTWSPVNPSKASLEALADHSPFKFVDPNELNKKCGIPPHYVIIKKNYTDLLEWVNKYFINLKFSKETTDDLVFEGDFKGY